MQTVTLKIEDTISEKFMWFLSHFNQNEVSILESHLQIKPSPSN